MTERERKRAEANAFWAAYSESCRIEGKPTVSSTGGYGERYEGMGECILA